MGRRMSARTKRRSGCRARAKRDARWKAELVSCLPPGLEWEPPYLEAFEIIRDLVEGTHFQPVERRIVDRRQFQALAALGYRVDKVPDQPFTYRIDFTQQLHILIDYMATQQAEAIDKQVTAVIEAMERQRATAEETPPSATEATDRQTATVEEIPASAVESVTDATAALRIEN